MEEIKFDEKAFNRLKVSLENAFKVFAGSVNLNKNSEEILNAQSESLNVMKEIENGEGS